MQLPSLRHLLLCLPIALAACGGGDQKVTPVADAGVGESATVGLNPVKENKQQEAGGNLAVNAYLWRGALDTLSFMPLASIDPFGGVIITDWYSPPTTTGERFKATAYVLGRQLRTDGLRVTIFRQVQDGGQWVDAPVDPATVADIENKALERARELRAQAVAK
jgi:hypothetical protein